MSSYLFHFSFVTNSAWFLFIPTLDDPGLLNQLIESLPPLPPCELVDPADDQTLPRLIEALEKRQQIRQMLVEQFNKTGENLFFSQEEYLNVVDRGSPYHEVVGSISKPGMAYFK